MFTIRRLLALAAWLSFTTAQTSLSTVPVIDGNTVVVAITTDPLGNTSPVVIGTVSDPALTTPAATPGLTTTTPVVGATSTPLATSAAPTVTSSTPRVVGQPGPTNADPGPTVYTYMTTDASGNPTQVVDTYTPNFVQATTSLYTPRVGSVIPYDQYTSMYGGGSGGGGSAAINSANRQNSRLGLGAAAVMCILGGAAVLL
ncbi:hypothetical protein RhiJN_17854 [Ceratobasidium sp. AG-Ba]|nr:hypothetical protein RhiJN_17854 [Ceratobasidium sp. AG-Ba]